jgi:hypothetical protein
MGTGPPGKSKPGDKEVIMYVYAFYEGKVVGMRLGKFCELVKAGKNIRRATFAEIWALRV